MRRRDAASRSCTAAPVRGSCPTCGTSREAPADHVSVARCALLLLVAIAVTGCDSACYLMFENHTSRPISLRPHDDEVALVEVPACGTASLGMSFGLCGLDFVAEDESGDTVAVSRTVSENMPGSPLNLFRAGVGSEECDDPPQVAVYVTVHNRTGVPATLQVDGTDAGEIPPDAERRLGPVPGNLAHKFYPKVIATDPDGQPLRVERVAVDQGGTAVPMMSVEVLPPEAPSGG